MSFEDGEVDNELLNQGHNNPFVDVVEIFVSQVDGVLLTREQFLEKLRDRMNISSKDTTPEKFFKGFKNFEIYNLLGECIGEVQIHLRERNKTIFIRSVDLLPNFRKKGYGKSIYKYIQEMFIEYTLISDKESMISKSSKDQEEGDAVYLWESLCKEGVAKKIDYKDYRFNNNI